MNPTRTVSEWLAAFDRLVADLVMSDLHDAQREHVAELVALVPTSLGTEPDPGAKINSILSIRIGGYDYASQ